MTSDAGPAPRPLAGIRVLDLSRVLAGPFATQQLADLGAEVIKLESPDGGDATRGWGPPFLEDGRSAYFLATNRGKRSIAVDLDAPEGRGVLERLAATADLLVENFRPGQLADWGLGLARLRERNPRLITLTITGFGTGGARAGDPGYDALVQAMTGVMAITGPAAGEACKAGVAVVDIATGLFGAIAVLAALVARAGSNPASQRHFEVSLYDSALAMLSNVASSVLVSGRDAPRAGNAHESIVPYQVFAAADGDFFLAVGSDRQWRGLVRVLDWEARFPQAEWGSNAARVRGRARLVAALAQEFGRHPCAELLERLHAAGVPAGPLRGVRQALEDPDFVGRSGVVRLRDGTRSVSSPIRGEGDRSLPATEPAPALGASTREVLRSLGYGDAEVATLLARGVVSEPPPADGKLARA